MYSVIMQTTAHSQAPQGQCPRRVRFAWARPIGSGRDGEQTRCEFGLTMVCDRPKHRVQLMSLRRTSRRPLPGSPLYEHEPWPAAKYSIL